MRHGIAWQGIATIVTILHTGRANNKCVCVYGHDVCISIKKTAIILAVASFSTVTVFNFLKIESTCTLS